MFIKRDIYHPYNTKYRENELRVKVFGEKIKIKIVFNGEDDRKIFSKFV